MNSDETSWIIIAPTTDLCTKEPIPSNTIITNGVKIRNDVIGMWGDKKVRVRSLLTRRLDRYKRAQEKDMVWTLKDPNEYPHIWHPVKRMMTVEDAEDLHTGKIIKKDTVFEDWCDNEDGTVEATLDGKVVYRLWKDSITKLLL